MNSIKKFFTRLRNNHFAKNLILAVLSTFLVASINFSLLLHPKKIVKIRYSTIVDNSTPSDIIASGEISITYHTDGTKDRISYILESISFNNDITFGTDTCIIGLYNAEAGKEGPLVLFNRPICAVDVYTHPYTENLTATVEIDADRHLYPYDQISFNEELQFFGYFDTNSALGNNPQGLSSSITAKIEFPGREISTPTIIKEDAKMISVRTPVYASRSILYRVLTFIFGILITLLISIMWFIDDINTLFQMAIGILFGLWSIREIISTETISYLTLLDVVFLSLYMYLLLLCLIHIPRLVRARINKTSG